MRRDYCEVLLKVYDLAGDASSLEKARELVNNERSLQAVERLEELYQVLCEYGVEKYVSFDLGLLSKYNYYTGVVFKAYTYGVGDAVAKGGRYDHLLEHFGKSAPAIGFVLVVDDLLEALSRQKRKPEAEPDGVLIVYEDGCFHEALDKARQLRREGRAVELMPAVLGGIENYQEAADAHMQCRILYYAEDGCRLAEKTPGKDREGWTKRDI